MFSEARKVVLAEESLNASYERKKFKCEDNLSKDKGNTSTPFKKKNEGKY